jgi:hypothetical protein
MEDKEIKAIADIIAALEGLDPLAKSRVFRYVVERMNIQGTMSDSLAAPEYPSFTPITERVIPSSDKSFTNIRSLKEEKKPNSDIQMAVLVAYYLKEVATGEEKKESINVADIEKYFVQGDFPLPKRPVTALTNAKSAGYLESADRGRYKLNPVGHNLIVHGLPLKGGLTNGTKTKKGKKKGSAKK